MLRTRLAAVVAAAAILVLPAAAFADSAGDNQYQDPFGNTPTQPKQQKNKSSGTQGNTTPAPSAPAPAPVSSTAPAQTTPTATTAATGSSDTLPRTGFPLLPVAAIGAALVAAGLALRRLV